MENILTLILIDSRSFVDIMLDLYTSKLLFEIKIYLDRVVEFKAFTPDGLMQKCYSIPFENIFYSKRDNNNVDFILCCFYNNKYKSEPGFFKLAQKSEIHLRIELNENSKSTIGKTMKVVRRDKDGFKSNKIISLSNPNNKFNSDFTEIGKILFEFDLESPNVKLLKEVAENEVEIFSQKREQNNLLNMKTSVFNITLSQSSRITKYNDDHVLVKFPKKWLKFLKKIKYHVKVYEKIIVFECAWDNSTILLKDFIIS
jgi:hypothetical protein